MGIHDIALCGLAKRDEELFVPWQDTGPVVLPGGSASLYLVKQVRDEAHRFAIEFHRQLRGKGMTRYEKLSTDRSDCRLSFASPVGLLLSCNHIYNQYVLIDNSEETLQKFEKSARNMQSLSRYSRSNSINREWIDQYLNEAHSYGLPSSI